MKRIPRSTDRRVLRTRAVLRDALITLVGESGWDAITVQDICDRAKVGRSTFYTHFADKEDLLVSGFDDLRKLIEGLRPPVQRGDVALGFASPLIEHAYENQRLFRALVGKRSGLVAIRRFRELVTGLTEGELKDVVPGPHLAAVVHYTTGAFVELVTWWLDSARQLRPDEIDSIFQQLTMRVVTAARGLRASKRTRG